jgi:hypothetical protein
VGLRQISIGRAQKLFCRWLGQVCAVGAYAAVSVVKSRRAQQAQTAFDQAAIDRVQASMRRL